MGYLNFEFDYETGTLHVDSLSRKSLNMNDDETTVAEHFITVIHNAAPDIPVRIERRSNDYVSLFTGEFDFLRFKYSPRSRWLSVDTFGLNLSPDDIRFAAQKKKTARHWKAEIKDLSALQEFDDLVISSCLSCAARE